MVRPIISAKVKFSEAAKAHAMLEARAVEGRVVMRGW
jgi:NADPH:quinone reductase-like Zn-dependent oxidoreductase